MSASSRRASQIEAGFEEAEELTGIDFAASIDGVEDADLPPKSPLAVSTREDPSGYGKDVVLLVDSDFDYLNRHQQRIGLEHEGFHAMRNKGQFSQLLNDIGSPELQRSLHRMDTMESDFYEEGLVQAMANTVDPYGHEGKVFRNRETQAVENFLREDGIELEEVIDGAESAINDLADSYREIDRVWHSSGYRIEQGSFAGQGYTAIAEDDYGVLQGLADYATSGYSGAPEGDYVIGYGGETYDGVENMEEDWEPSLFIPELEE